MRRPFECILCLFILVVCSAALAAPLGTLDTGFAGGGIGTFDFSTLCGNGGVSNDFAAAIALGTDGISPVLAGRSIDSVCYYASVAQLSRTGAATAQYGFAIEQSAASTPNTVNAVLEVGGLLVYGGEAYSVSAGIDTAYLETSSGAFVRIQLPVSGTYSTVSGLALDSAGAIYAVGNYRTTGGTTRAYVAKFDTSLTAQGLFGGFGNHGVVSFAASLSALGEFDEFTAVAIDAQGRPVAVGRTGNFPCATCQANDDFLIVRFTASGQIDTTFGGSGEDIIDFDGADHWQPVANPIGGGVSNSCDANPQCYNLAQDDRATAVAIDSLQRIVVVGYTQQFLTDNGTPPSQGGLVTWNGHAYGIVKLTADGYLDLSTFGSNNVEIMVNDYGGSSILTLSAPAIFWSDAGGIHGGDANGVVIDRADAFDVSGSVGAGSNLHDIGLARFVETLSPIVGDEWAPDPAFGNSGLTRIHLDQNFGVPADTQGTAMALDAQGRLLIAGYTNQNDQNAGSGYDFLAARVLSDGIFRDGFEITNPVP